MAMTAALLIGCAAHVRPDPAPLVYGHAHNDYAHDRPRAEALECGFCSIEADICLVNGKLLVAHDPKKTSPHRTLESLYLEPLRKRIAEHGGRVYRGGPTVTLMIDFKTPAAATYPVLRKLLLKYADLLTRYQDDKKYDGALKIILTGSRPRPEMLAAENPRYVAIDGVLADLDRDYPHDLMPQMNVQWTKVFQWKGDGPLPAEDRSRLRDLVARAHAKGRQIRFWDAPDQPNAWRELLDAGVDWINTDNLRGLRVFFDGQTSS